MGHGYLALPMPLCRKGVSHDRAAIVDQTALAVAHTRLLADMPGLSSNRFAFPRLLASEILPAYKARGLAPRRTLLCLLLAITRARLLADLPPPKGEQKRRATVSPFLDCRLAMHVLSIRAPNCWRNMLRAFAHMLIPLLPAFLECRGKAVPPLPVVPGKPVALHPSPELDLHQAGRALI